MAHGISRIAGWSGKRRLVTSGLLVLTVLVLVLPTTSSRFFLGRPLEQLRAGEQRWKEVGSWIDNNTPPDTFIATNVAGRLPYAAQRRTLDILGLCDAVVARTPIASAGAGYAGHERAAPRYVMDRAPDLIYISVLDGLPFHVFAHLPSAARFLARTDLRGYAPMLEFPDFARGYAPARIRLGADTFANVYVRPERSFVTDASTGLLVANWRP